MFNVNVLMFKNFVASATTFSHRMKYTESEQFSVVH